MQVAECGARIAGYPQLFAVARPNSQNVPNLRSFRNPQTAIRNQLSPNQQAPVVLCLGELLVDLVPEPSGARLEKARKFACCAGRLADAVEGPHTFRLLLLVDNLGYRQLHARS
jgi:hypothetical protein